VGRINFTGATAQEVTIGYSAGRNISLVAYDSDNNMLSYTGGSENYNRGCLWYLTVEDIDIAYVLVCGEANYFLIDDIYVVDLPGITESMLAPNYEIELEDFTYLDQGNSENYNLNLGDDEALETILNWGDGEFNLKIYDSNEDLYGEWQSGNPPIIADVPYAESGDWEFEVTAVSVTDDEYYALIVGGMEIPLTTSSVFEPSSWLSTWIDPMGLATVKGIIYDMPGGYSVDDIDIESVRLSSTIEDINGEIEVFPSWPGINGSVAVAEFLRNQAVASLGPDPEMGYYTVTLSGEYTNEVPFESEAQIHYVIVGGMPDLFDRPGDLIPKEFFLSQNFPNPFNPITTFNYGLPQDSHVNLTVYNVGGQKIATIVDDYQEVGYKSIIWNATEFSSGIYFYRLTAGDNVFTKRMTLLK
ncbi:MAG: T9SS type A sorting domain-containing protein, partial [candidate division Zixibacteria bacterium]|nr:T9SS type A sorting domain-containing protein [candidate division Zixibacteria bacterium]